MPLVKMKLSDALRKFMDAESSSFKAFPQDEPDAIELLADAVDQFASGVMPSSKTASAAKAAMMAAMTGLGEADQAISKIQDGFTQYATILAAGMIGSPAGPGVVVTAVAPSGKVAIDSVGEIGLNGGTSQDVADAIASIADTWFKTGQTTIIVGSATSAGPTWM